MFLIGTAFGSKKFNVVNFLKKKSKNPNRIVDKTGPLLLTHCSSNEDTLSLGLSALKKLSKKINFDQVELLISITETPKSIFPGNSFEYATQFRLDKNTELFDINSGCTGFLDALTMSLKLKKKTIIVCSESYSKHMKKKEISTSSLFSDAATATFVNPKKFKIIYEDYEYLENTSKLLKSDNSEGLYMNGSEVYLFTKKVVIPMISKVLKKFPNVKSVFCHQASLLVLNMIKEEFSKKKIELPINIKSRGNTVSSSIPILIDDFQKKNTFNKVNIFIGFGVGLQSRVLVIKND